MIRALLGFCLGVTLIWGAAACGSDGDKKTKNNGTCTTDDECDEPFYECESVDGTNIGTCTQPCVMSAECPEGFTCKTATALGLEGSCLQVCGDKACPSEHECVSDADGDRFCAPTAWKFGL